MTTATPIYDKQIIYDRESRDYAMYLDGELVGFARNHHEAEVTLDQLVWELLHGCAIPDDPPLPWPLPDDADPPSVYGKEAIL